MMHYYDYGWYGWGMFSFLFYILFWVLVIWLVVTLVKRVRIHHEEPPRSIEQQKPAEMKEKKEEAIDPAMAILRERFARGDISKEEFEERKRVLNS